MEHARFGKFTQAIHWVTAILVLAAFIYGPGGSEQRVYAASRDLGRQIHETLGLCVFALLVVRVLWRLVDQRPQPEDLPRWMALSAKALQGGLYLLLIAVPMTAIMGAWLEGHPLTLIAGVTIGPWVTLSHDTGASISEIHTLLGDAIVWLAGFHAVAALYHHFILKDRVLVSMLPRWIIPER